MATALLMGSPTAQPKLDVNSFHFNVFRTIGDFLHLLGIVALIAVLCKNRSCKGISRSTQILYFLVFVSRYLDLFQSPNTYLVVFKVTYISTSAIVLVIFHMWDATYERSKDTCSLMVILFPCIVSSVLLASTSSVQTIFWTCSRFLEGFAMVPQYIFCYRDKASTDKWLVLYVMAKGFYRVFYALNWAYKAVHDNHYKDVNAWIGGVIEIGFFLDYMLARFTASHASVLRSMTLAIDEKINEIKHAFGIQVLGSKKYEESSTEDVSELSKRSTEPDERSNEAVDV